MPRARRLPECEEESSLSLVKVSAGLRGATRITLVD
jgi:hypothetical protein